MEIGKECRKNETGYNAMILYSLGQLYQNIETSIEWSKSYGSSDGVVTVKNNSQYNIGNNDYEIEVIYYDYNDNELFRRSVTSFYSIPKGSSVDFSFFHVSMPSNARRARGNIILTNTDFIEKSLANEARITCDEFNRNRTIWLEFQESFENM